MWTCVCVVVEFASGSRGCTQLYPKAPCDDIAHHNQPGHFITQQKPLASNSSELEAEVAVVGFSGESTLARCIAHAHGFRHKRRFEMLYNVAPCIAPI